MNAMDYPALEPIDHPGSDEWAERADRRRRYHQQCQEMQMQQEADDFRMQQYPQRSSH